MKNNHDEETRAFLKTVGARIEKIREIRGMTRNDLASATGTAYASIYSVERHHNGTQIDTIFKIAKALGVTPGALLDGVTLTVEKRVVETVEVSV
jgi:transcriptional regulator with XRE-family HTH domain